MSVHDEETDGCPRLRLPPAYVSTRRPEHRRVVAMQTALIERDERRYKP